MEPPPKTKILHIAGGGGRDASPLLKALEAAGAEVKSVAPGEKTIELLKNSRFDTLLIELDQPDIREAKLLQRLKQTLPQFACLLLSESPIADDSHTYLLNPPYTRDLLLTLESAVEKQKLVWENMRIINELKRTNQRLLKMHRDAKEAKEELEQAQNRLVQSEKLASMGRLSASIAHEVNHPITVIILYAKLMLEKLKTLNLPDDLRAEWERYLNITYGQMTRCGNIVKNILEFSRQSKPSARSVCVGDRLGHVLDLLAHKAALQQIEIRRNFTADDIIKASPEQLEQVFLSLIINAIDSMPGGGMLTVITRKDSTPSMPDCLAVEISDTGAGIPRDELKNIFEPFYTTKEGGAGLGLAVVYNIIVNHEGEITVDSEPGKGTRFTMRLPRKKG